MIMRLMIGNKRDNVIRKLQDSKVALFWLLVSWMYMYRILQESVAVHLQEIVFIGVSGIVLVNLVYVPYRLMIDSKLDSDIKLLFTLVFTISLICYLRSASEFSVRFIFGSMISIIVISLSVTGIFVAVVKSSSVHLQNNRRKIFDREYDKMEGHDFEYYCADLLKRKGFRKVTVTQGSGDYGIDIIAWKDNVKYGIQCKRYSGNVGYHAVEESYTGASIYNCNRAVVMTNSDFTKQAIKGARRLGVELWGSEMFG